MKHRKHEGSEIGEKRRLASHGKEDYSKPGKGGYKEEKIEEVDQEQRFHIIISTSVDVCVSMVVHHNYVFIARQLCLHS